MAKKRDGKEILKTVNDLIKEVREMRERHDREMASTMCNLIGILASIREEFPTENLELVEQEVQESEPLFADAVGFVVGLGQASSTILSKNFEISYSRAARLMDMLEDAGVVGPARGSLSRQVHISKPEPKVENVLKQIAAQIKKQIK